MALTVEQIRKVCPDEKLLELLLGELKQLFPPEVRKDRVVFLSRLQSAPRGLRAMASTYDLDASLALDDLAWHFVNHHDSLELAEETVFGLRELEAPEAADLFLNALHIIKPRWHELEKGIPSSSAHDWLDSTGMQSAINPLNDRLRTFLKPLHQNSFFMLWTAYARKYPEYCVLGS